MRKRKQGCGKQLGPHPGLFVTELLGQGLAWVSLQARLLPAEFLLPTCAHAGHLGLTWL